MNAIATAPQTIARVCFVRSRSTTTAAAVVAHVETQDATGRIGLNSSAIRNGKGGGILAPGRIDEYHDHVARRFFIASFVLSLLLFFSSVVLWVRSYWVADLLVMQNGNWTSNSGSTRGALFRNSVGPPPSGSLRPVLSSGYVREPAFSLRLGRVMRGDPGIRHEAGAMGFWWFVSDGGGSVTVPSPDASLPLGGSYGSPTFSPLHQYAIPHWFIALLLGCTSLSCFVAARRSQQRWLGSRGRCLRCGYDLRATPDRCPECGATRMPPP